MQRSESSGKLVIEADDVSYAWGDLPVIRNFSATILRGDRIGVIGPNGAGKSTLLNLLLGRLQPDSGILRRGTRLEVAYFDQMRAALDETRSVRDNVADGSDKVEINGVSKHVIGYLQDFLFTPDRANQPVSALSGGERNRLLLARLFTRPANLLVMDEPTNDLDMETLELLEELLLGYQGTLLLVSHDRAFLNNVVTGTLAFEGNGRVGEYVGGYDDWLVQRPQAERPAAKSKVSEVAPPKEPVKAKKLSYKVQRELEQLPQLIDELEQQVVATQEQLADPALYKGHADRVNELQQQLVDAERALAEAYRRWEDLEEG